MQIVLINLQRVFELAIPQQAVIDEYARLPLANSLMDKHGSDGRINAAGQAADDVTCRADGLSDLFDLFCNKLSRRPIAFAMTNFEYEIS